MTADKLRPVVGGDVVAPVLKLDAPISFWGGVDMETGRIIDRSHPQSGCLIGGYCIAVPMIRGSGGTPGSLAMMIKLGCGPAALVVGYPDINVMTGVMVARHLYGTGCPLFVATDDQLARFCDGGTAKIDAEGGFAVG